MCGRSPGRRRAIDQGDADLIAIVDAGCGNLRSVAAAFAAGGHEAMVTSDPELVRRSSHLVVPGQGAFAGCMGGLERAGVLPVLAAALAREVPYLGICLGLQILFEGSDEGGPPGLGVCPGRVVRFEEGRIDPASGQRFKVPHMGWNELEDVRAEGPLAAAAAGDHVYFVHSYHARATDPSVVSAWAVHGERFVAAVTAGRICATQFHPEKSGDTGLRILDAFARLPS